MLEVIDLVLLLMALLVEGVHRSDLWCDAHREENQRIAQTHE